MNDLGIDDFRRWTVVRDVDVMDESGPVELPRDVTTEGGARLTITGSPIEFSSSGYWSSSHRARLAISGRIPRSFPVAIEMSPSSSKRDELMVRPTKHIPRYYSERKYIAAVNSVLDLLEDELKHFSLH